MSQSQESKEFYQRLKTRLEEYSWPSDYMFKFIVPTDNRKLALIRQVFDGHNPRVSTRASKNQKYTSVTIMVYVLDSDSIISFYNKVGDIEGVISL